EMDSPISARLIAPECDRNASNTCLCKSRMPAAAFLPASGILDLQRQVLEALRSHSGAMSLADIGTSISAPDRVETIYQLVRHLVANGRLTLAEGDLSCPASIELVATP
ncbi:MAG: hypothetical protein AAFY15_08120, partial [Cyanobacteria bacterium J06648_11]